MQHGAAQLYGVKRHLHSSHGDGVKHPADAMPADLASQAVSAAQSPPKQGRYDSQARRRAARTQRERGCWVYIPAEELRAAGIDPYGERPWYRLTGRQRSANGRSVIVSLYSEP